MFAYRDGDMFFLRTIFGRIFQHDGSCAHTGIDTIVAESGVIAFCVFAQFGEEVFFFCADDRLLHREFAIDTHPSIDVVDTILIRGGTFHGEFDFRKASSLITQIDVFEFCARSETVVFVEGKEVDVGLHFESDGIFLTTLGFVELHIDRLGAVVEVIVKHGFATGEEQSQS